VGNQPSVPSARCHLLIQSLLNLKYPNVKLHMTIKNIDVVSAGPSSDVAILAVRDALADELTCSSVLDMVYQIQQTLGANSMIGRLRIFGHGSPGLVCVGQVPRGTNLSSLNFTQLSKYIGVVRRDEIQEGGAIVRTSYPIFNEEHLLMLRPKFNRSGYVELHACQAAAGEYGEQLLRRLAEIWRVQVKGGIEDQFIGGGIEGTSIVAFPHGNVQRHPPTPPPHVPSCSAGRR
jgi:hypothetical protein